MKYVIMVSHGELAAGLHSAVKMMVGDREDVMSIGLLENMKEEDFNDSFQKLLTSVTDKDQVILLADMLSGTPFSNALVILNEKHMINNAIVIAGMNLPLVLTAIMMKDTYHDDELLKNALLDEGHAGLSEFTFAASDDLEDGN